ncbi:hypothetical protein AWQ22_12840 [Picosynechococcus sp. PCC 7117]|nr:hypothetical protein AWQ22_12840 [Picosynechococcus sp. PCC 7117]
MKELFQWKLPLSKENYDNLWREAIFIFDTNFLLDLYRGSSSTTDDLIKILQELKDRIWLPYQVADEFLDRREKIFNEGKNSFNAALEAIETWKCSQLKLKDLQEKLKQSGRIINAEIEEFFDLSLDEYDKQVNQVSDAICSRIAETQESHRIYSLNEDSVLPILLELFEEKVGLNYEQKILENLYKEGETRYEREQPPGFKDKNKEDDRKYGDLILWK